MWISAGLWTSMKNKAFIILLICVLLHASMAAADAFLDDFNLYAEAVYSINKLETIHEDDTMTAYRAGTVEIMRTDGEISIFGESAEDVITFTCCAIRCMDDTGSLIDQYGRILHSFFLCKAGREGRAVTESGITVFTTAENGIYNMKLVQ